MSAKFPGSLNARLCAAAALLALGACAHSESAAVADRTFSEDVGRMALDAQRQMETEPPAALALLNEALDDAARPFERYTLLRMRGTVNYELDDLDGSIRDFEEALTLAGQVGTPKEASDLSINLGQIRLKRANPEQGDLEEGVRLLERWLAENPPRESVAMTLGQTLAQAGAYDEALPYAEQARALARPVQAKHLALLAFLYGHLGRQDDLDAVRRDIDAMENPAG